MIRWNRLTLTDGEGCELTKARSIEALREFKATGGIHQVFVQHDGLGIDDPEDVDWDGFPVDLTAEEIEFLGTMTTKDESGKHFTELYSAELIAKLEAGGYIEIFRPVHDSGIPYSQEHWRLRITEKTENLF